MTGPLFISTMTGTLDGKGRVCIPAAWREALTAQETAGVYLRPSFVDRSLEGFGDALMRRYHAEQAAKSPYLGGDVDAMAFAVLTTTQILPRDENGRVRLPDEFITHAGLKDRVVFLGIGDRFQIWEPDAFAAIREEKLERAKAQQAALAARSASA